MSAAPALVLPVSGGGLAPFALGAPRAFPPRSGRPPVRAAFAAAHVVADPLADADPWLAPALDWEATLAFRRHLWRLGLGVAEAMDTAQRGMGLDWPASPPVCASPTSTLRASVKPRRGAWTRRRPAGIFPKTPPAQGLRRRRPPDRMPV